MDLRDRRPHRADRTATPGESGPAELSRGRRPPTQTDPRNADDVVFATALILAALLMVYATMSLDAGGGGIVIAVACIAGSAAILHRIKRRGSANLPDRHGIPRG